jgi:hypothetical protein
VAMRRFICWTFNRHCEHLHNADFDVCRSPACRLAGWLEGRFFWWLYVRGRKGNERAN